MIATSSFHPLFDKARDNFCGDIADQNKSIIFNTPPMLMVFGVAATILHGIRRALTGGIQFGPSYGCCPFQFGSCFHAPGYGVFFLGALSQRFWVIPISLGAAHV